MFAGILAAMPISVAAQDDGSVSDQTDGSSILGVVDAGSGTVNARGDRLTLHDVDARALWFSDRPGRKTGAFTIPELIRAFFKGQVPPNAALEFLGAREKNDVALVELSEPRYNRKAERLTFAVRLLDDPSSNLSADTALDDHVARHDGRIPKSFGATSVFIDSATLAGLSTDTEGEFSLTVENQSNESWDFFTFIRVPNADPQLVSLAWVSQYVAPHNTVEFTWDADFSLMWARVGSLAAGVVFSPEQTLPADPSASQPARAGQPGRWADLTFNTENGLFSFVDGEAVLDPAPDTLFIQSDATVPNAVASVGIGLGGDAAFARPALTNISANFPTDGLSYFVAAAPSMQAGAVLDPVVQDATELPFAEAPDLTATFGADHTWTVGPSEGTASGE